ncbi:MAG: hypothetical protein LCH53_14285 [Bacteroidetes bacterium]|nr:hypothetical protein [Bacteroidota bacterium]
MSATASVPAPAVLRDVRTWSFDLVVDQDMTDLEGSNALFEAFEGDVTPAVLAGVPHLMCTVEAPDLLGAVRQTIQRVEALGLGVRVLHVQMEPESFGDGA